MRDAIPGQRGRNRKWEDGCHPIVSCGETQQVWHMDFTGRYARRKHTPAKSAEERVEGNFICPLCFHLSFPTVAFHERPEVKGRLGKDEVPTERETEKEVVEGI